VISKARAQKLKPLLDAFADDRPWGHRVGADPIELVHRYQQPRDVEVSGLLAAALAYGRADLFKPKVDRLLRQMGRSPAAFVEALTVAGAARLLDGFVYRFNLGTDVAVLLMGMGATLHTHGSLEALVVEGLTLTGTLHGALAHFTKGLREAAPLSQLRAKLGPDRGLHHLLPHPLGAGAAKRLNLYLRWMVRGPDKIDFGVWRQIPSARLIIPLDTHVQRISKLLGLTRRNDLSWRTAEDVTASLRMLDPDDPVRYDFALCHYGMSGACPAAPVRTHCLACSLKGECRVGKRLGSQ
jgi:uncharacterized protein (TIGR02757 family)